MFKCFKCFCLTVFSFFFLFSLQRMFFWSFFEMQF
uniref:Uncharacterized protein n=1 Tax=Anguilla anguilla TaxID=7936 RepID=A0A0E9USN8_ANGAN